MRLSKLALLLPIVALTACTANIFGGGNTLSYTLSFDSEDAARQTQLASGSARVIERRLLGMNQTLEKGDVAIAGNTLTVKAENKEIADQLREQLSRPFTMQVMLEADDASADIRHPQFGAFKDAGINETHFDWVNVRAADGGKASATLQLTPEGKHLLKTVFEQNEGKTIGIFLRSVLMSKRVITKGDPTESITIEGIPSMDIASIFADDVNVGLHVTFTEDN